MMLFSPVAMLPNKLLMPVPRIVAPPPATSEMSATSRAYSASVAPHLSRTNLLVATMSLATNLVMGCSSRKVEPAWDYVETVLLVTVGVCISAHVSSFLPLTILCSFAIGFGSRRARSRYHTAPPSVANKTRLE